MILESNVVLELINNFNPSRYFLIYIVIGLSYFTLLWFVAIYYFAPQFYSKAKGVITGLFSLAIATSDVIAGTISIGLAHIFEPQINYSSIISSSVMGIAGHLMFILVWAYFRKIYSRHPFPFQQIIVYYFITRLVMMGITFASELFH